MSTSMSGLLSKLSRLAEDLKGLPLTEQAKRREILTAFTQKRAKSLPFEHFCSFIDYILAVKELPFFVNFLIDDYCNPSQESRLRYLSLKFKMSPIALDINANTLFISAKPAQKSEEEAKADFMAFSTMLSKACSAPSTASWGYINFTILLEDTDWEIVWHDPVSELFSVKHVHEGGHRVVPYEMVMEIYSKAILEREQEQNQNQNQNPTRPEGDQNEQQQQQQQQERGPTVSSL